jgi:integrase/recombinase XerC/integrase/recombinase XerD
LLAAICSRRPRKDITLNRLRDRVLFETAYSCDVPGLRSASSTGHGCPVTVRRDSPNR